MHNKFEINRTKITGGCQSGRKLVTHNSKSDLPLAALHLCETCARDSDTDIVVFSCDILTLFEHTYVH